MGLQILQTNAPTKCSHTFAYKCYQLMYLTIKLRMEPQTNLYMQRQLERQTGLQMQRLMERQTGLQMQRPMERQMEI